MTDLQEYLIPKLERSYSPFFYNTEKTRRILLSKDGYLHAQLGSGSNDFPISADEPIGIIETYRTLPPEEELADRLLITRHAMRRLDELKLPKDILVLVGPDMADWYNTNTKKWGRDEGFPHTHFYDLDIIDSIKDGTITNADAIVRQLIKLFEVDPSKYETDPLLDDLLHTLFFETTGVSYGMAGSMVRSVGIRNCVGEYDGFGPLSWGILEPTGNWHWFG